MQQEISSLKFFFSLLNNNCEYLVLRNWDDIFDETIYGKEHEDIDVLCRSVDEFKRLSNARRIHKSKYRDNFLVNIGGHDVRFDVRHVGDGYYPREWEDMMLKRRVLTDKGFYIMSQEDYAYSLTYHALLQKPELSKEYQAKISNAFHQLNSNIAYSTFSKLLEALLSYCQRNNYNIEIPSDPGVFINKKNFSDFKRSFNLGRLLRRKALHIRQLTEYYSRRLLSVFH
jgi:hypothetical protein